MSQIAVLDIGIILNDYSSMVIRMEKEQDVNSIAECLRAYWKESEAVLERETETDQTVLNLLRRMGKSVKKGTVRKIMYLK